MRFTIGDIHGRKEALLQCLERSNFDKENDLLIVLGDVCDGGYNTYECVEILLTIKNVIYIIGNHDEWFLDHIKSGWSKNLWLNQGGKYTIKSYGGEVEPNTRGFGGETEPTKDVSLPDSHRDFFNNGLYHYILDNMVFVHGGFNPMIKLDKNSKEKLLWDRDLIETAREKPIYRNDKLPIDKSVVWDKVFVGHTTTETFGYATVPLKFNNLWMVDTGAGWTGKLTIMNIDTEEYWQSDKQEPAGR